MKAKTAIQKISSLLNENKDNLTGSELLDVATLCQKLFHKKLHMTSGSRLIGKDITRAPEIFTIYHLRASSH